MADPNQEFETNPGNLSDDTIDFNLLRLDTFTPSCKNCSSPTLHHPSCTSSGCSGFPINPSSSNKRRSPNSTASIISDQIPKRPKKLFLEPFETTTTAAASAKIAETMTTPLTKGTASLPPRPPFRRCFSDVSPVKSFSSGSNNDLSFDVNSDYQLLKKMKNCTREMTQWFADVLPDETVAEDEEDKGVTIEDSAADITQANLVTESDEHVFAERTGDSLIVHFKCPCSRGFQILLSGTHCYYKLL
ncbi:hypothetical protein M5689_007781 [Euphorbia peplus]|nr:hypothetical protein M5689_007781 [Euphorbia peplus]